MSAIAPNCSAVVAVLLILMGCSPSTSTSPTAAHIAQADGARLSVAEVIRVASDAAKDAGVDLRDFGEPKLLYPWVGQPDTWLVTFKRHPARPVGGDFFSVSVDDHTGATRMLGGA